MDYDRTNMPAAYDAGRGYSSRHRLWNWPVLYGAGGAFQCARNRRRSVRKDAGGGSKEGKGLAANSRALKSATPCQCSIFTDKRCLEEFMRIAPPTTVNIRYVLHDLDAAVAWCTKHLGFTVHDALGSQT